jgi:hypothetical protein
MDFCRKDLTFDCTDPIKRHRKFPRFFDGKRFHSMNFTDLGLSPEVLQAVSDTGYTTPTPIQAQAIPVILTGRDVLGCAQTGTGKTAGFTLPMIDILAAGRAKARMPRSLILEPTRSRTRSRPTASTTSSTWRCSSAARASPTRCASSSAASTC